MHEFLKVDQKLDRLQPVVGKVKESLVLVECSSFEAVQVVTTLSKDNVFIHVSSIKMTYLKSKI